MVYEELRRAAEAAPRERLPMVASALWQAFGAGGISEAQAAEIEALLQARLRAAAPPGPGERKRRASIPRPRDPEEVELRRRMAAGGWLPPAIACRFTPGEQAALAVVAREIGDRGSCMLCHKQVADLAGVGLTTVRNALRQARLLGLVRVEERRLDARRNDTNVVTLSSPEWAAWLRLRTRKPAPGGGVRGTTRSRIQEVTVRKPWRGKDRPWLPRGGDGQHRRGSPQAVASAPPKAP